MIKREIERLVLKLARGYAASAITGPRQSGKTTLARAAFPDKAYVSLENPDTRELATQDPRGFLNKYRDADILDEVQNCPALFSYLQEILDSSDKSGRFVLTGSQQFGLIEGITQSLAGHPHGATAPLFLSRGLWQPPSWFGRNAVPWSLPADS